jgi:aspartate/methionine/tyrosine aminotransferase
LPEAGTCLWLDIGWTGIEGKEFASRLRARYGVAVWPGEHFGARGRGHIRISAGSEPEVLAGGLKGLMTFLAELESTP